MKNLKLILLCAFGVTLLQSCEDTLCVDGQGDVVDRQVETAPFHGIDIRTSAVIYLTENPDSENPVELRGQSNVLDELDIYVSQGILVIDERECYNTDMPVTAFIDFDELDYIELSGSGEIIGTNIFDVDDIEIILRGSGLIDIQLLSDDVETLISGSGDIRLEGECDDHDVDISGSGNIESFGLECFEGNVNISGSGNVEVFVKDELNVLITGSGSVFYKGFPTIQSTITGSGSIINSN